MVHVKCVRLPVELYMHSGLRCFRLIAACALASIVGCETIPQQNDAQKEVLPKAVWAPIISDSSGMTWAIDQTSRSDDSNVISTWIFAYKTNKDGEAQTRISAAPFKVDCRSHQYKWTVEKTQQSWVFPETDPFKVGEWMSPKPNSVLEGISTKLCGSLWVGAGGRDFRWAGTNGNVDIYFSPRPLVLGSATKRIVQFYAFDAIPPKSTPPLGGLSGGGFYVLELDCVNKMLRSSLRGNWGAVTIDLSQPWIAIVHNQTGIKVIQDYVCSDEALSHAAPNYSVATPNFVSGEDGSEKLEHTDADRPQVGTPGADATFNAAKMKCAELGFKPATEAFGKCVIQLTK